MLINVDKEDSMAKMKPATLDRVQMLLTELDEEMYGDGSWNYSDADDDDDVEIKKEPRTIVTYENNIENDQDYDTDLEGAIDKLFSSQNSKPSSLIVDIF